METKEPLKRRAFLEKGTKEGSCQGRWGGGGLASTFQPFYKRRLYQKTEKPPETFKGEAKKHHRR